MDYACDLAVSFAIILSGANENHIYLHTQSLNAYQKYWSRLKFTQSPEMAAAIVIDLRDSTPAPNSFDPGAKWSQLKYAIIIAPTKHSAANSIRARTKINIGRGTNILILAAAKYAAEMTQDAAATATVAPEQIDVAECAHVYTEYIHKMARLCSAPFLNAQSISAIREFQLPKSTVIKPANIDGGGDIDSDNDNKADSDSSAEKKSAHKAHVVFIVHITCDDQIEIALANKKISAPYTQKYICCVNEMHHKISQSAIAQLRSGGIMIAKSPLSDRLVALDVANNDKIAADCSAFVFLDPHIRIHRAFRTLVAPKSVTAYAVSPTQYGEIMIVPRKYFDYAVILNTVPIFADVFDAVHIYCNTKRIEITPISEHMIASAANDNIDNDIAATIIRDEHN
jgi:hypothetical protein